MLQRDWFRNTETAPRADRKGGAGTPKAGTARRQSACLTSEVNEEEPSVLAEHAAADANAAGARTDGSPAAQAEVVQYGASDKQAALASSLRRFLAHVEGTQELPPLEVLEELGAKLHASTDLPDTDLLSCFMAAAGGAVLRHEAAAIDDAADGAAEECREACAALQTAATCLNVMARPKVASSLIQEDLIDAVVEVTAKHLRANVLGFVDPKIGVTYRGRGDDGAENGEPSSTKKKKASARKTPAKKASRKTLVPAAFAPLASKLELCLQQLAHLTASVAVSNEATMVLMRLAIQTLAIDTRECLLLQQSAAALLVALFGHRSDMQATIMEEFVAKVLLVERSATTSDDGDVRPCTAALTRMLLAVCQQPRLGTTGAEPVDAGLSTALYWADFVCSKLLQPLHDARSSKLQGDVDVKACVQAVLADCMAVVSAAKHPSAYLVLLRMGVLLSGKAGAHRDAHVRQQSVDLLRTLILGLWREYVLAETDAVWASNVTGSDFADGLFAGAGDAYPATASAARMILPAVARDPLVAQFWCCRISAETQQLNNGEGAAGADPSWLDECARYWGDAAPNGLAAGALPMSDAEVDRLCRVVTHSGVLSRLRNSLLLALLDACSSRQVANTRAKAIKALGALAEVDPRVLRLRDVKEAVDKALADDAIMTREAAVDLIGKHMATDGEIAMLFFDTVCAAASDVGLSVRKRALRVLWDACVETGDCVRESEAVLCVMQRANDPEPSVQHLARSLFRERWAHGGGPKEEHVARVAGQLAGIASKLYEAAGGGLALPLSHDEPLVAILADAFGAGDGEATKAAGKAKLSFGRAVCLALANGLLEVRDADAARATPDTDPGCGHLVALHALATADAALVVPPSEPLMLVRLLTPHLKVDTSGPAARAQADALVCVLHVVTSALRVAEHIPDGEGNELARDLHRLISGHGYIQAVTAACQCLSALGHIHTRAAAYTARLAGQILARLSAVEAELRQSAPASWRDETVGLAARGMFCLGNLCRWGRAHLLEWGAEIDGACVPDDCLAVFVQFELLGGQDSRLQEAAVGAIGHIAAEEPAVLVRDDCNAILQRALSAAAPAGVTARALVCLRDLLETHERQLQEQQAAALADAQARNEGTAVPDAKPAALATVNGASDSTSLAGSVIQRFWDDVLSCALRADAGASFGVRAAETSPSSLVRLRVLELVSVVYRGGLVAPWTGVAHIVALATDPAPHIRAEALRIFRTLVAKHPQFIDARIGDGMVAVHDFHDRLAGGLHAEGGGLAVPRAATEGLAAVYEAIKEVRGLRAKFLTAALRRLEQACSQGHAPEGPAQLQALAFAAGLCASLPVRKADEALTMIAAIDSTVARRGELVQAALAEGLAAGDDAAGGELPAGVRSEAAIATVLCILLQLRRHLKGVYGITNERVALFNTNDEHRKQEERATVAAHGTTDFALTDLDLAAPLDRARAGQLLQHLTALLAEVEDVDCQAALSTRGKKRRRRVVKEQEAGAEGDAGEDANGVGQAEAPRKRRAPTRGRGRGRGRRGAGRRGAGRRSKWSDDEDTDVDMGGDSSESD
ncbi:unnamed protein product [Pedinophyceae sp. YPF-701]|nr:unnamed protein product [Pedinophyceae sp. YPF-701]